MACQKVCNTTNNKNCVRARFVVFSRGLYECCRTVDGRLTDNGVESFDIDRAWRSPKIQILKVPASGRQRRAFCAPDPQLSREPE